MIKSIQIEFTVETKPLNPNLISVLVNKDSIGYIYIMNYVGTNEIAGFSFNNRIYKTEEQALDEVIEQWRQLVSNNIPVLEEDS